MLELAVWGHFMVEADPAKVVDLSTQTWWSDGIAARYHHKHVHHESTCMERAARGCGNKVKKDRFSAEAMGVTNDAGCHGFYTCIDGVGYSCQDPKPLHSTCSESYLMGKDKYRCPEESAGYWTCRSEQDLFGPGLSHITGGDAYFNAMHNHDYTGTGNLVY